VCMTLTGGDLNTKQLSSLELSSVGVCRVIDREIDYTDFGLNVLRERDGI